jgi:hypothetical protein
MLFSSRSLRWPLQRFSSSALVTWAKPLPLILPMEYDLTMLTHIALWQIRAIPTTQSENAGDGNFFPLEYDLFICCCHSN